MFKFIILIIAVISNVGAQISLRYGMRSIKINRDSNLVYTLLIVLKNGYIWQGLLLYGIGFALYLYILSKFEVSYIYPILTASIFILLLTFSSFLLGESLTLKKIVGILIIIIGIFVASR